MTETPSDLHRAARRLRLLTLAATVLVGLGFLFAAIVLMTRRAEDLQGVTFQAGGLPPVPAGLMMLLFGSLVALALFRLVAMLRDVERGRFFPAKGLRGFARYLFLAVLASMFGPPILALAWGEREARLMIDSDQVLMLLVTGLLFLVARLLDEAQRVADDAAQIV